MDSVTINIYSIVGDALCVSAEDGEKVFERIEEAIKQGKKVVLNFQNVEMLTSAFLNTAVGKMYGAFDEQEIKNALSVTSMKPEDMALLKRVTDMAKQYFKDPELMDKAIKDILEE